MVAREEDPDLWTDTTSRERDSEAPRRVLAGARDAGRPLEGGVVYWSRARAESADPSPEWWDIVLQPVPPRA